MGIFKKLFGKKSTQKTTPETAPKLSVDANQSSEKFQHLADELVLFLTEKLQEINVLEKEIYERSLALKNPKEPNQVQPGETELWEEFKARRKTITAPVSLKPSDEGSRSFGTPTKYAYLNDASTKILFIMKSAKRAVIEMYFERGVGSKHQFVLRKIDDTWKIDTKKYGFQGERTWYKDVF